MDVSPSCVPIVPVTTCERALSSPSPAASNFQQSTQCETSPLQIIFCFPLTSHNHPYTTSPPLHSVINHPQTPLTDIQLVLTTPPPPPPDFHVTRSDSPQKTPQLPSLRPITHRQPPPTTPRHHTPNLATSPYHAPPHPHPHRHRPPLRQHPQPLRPARRMVPQHPTRHKTPKGRLGEHHVLWLLRQPWCHCYRLCLQA